MDAGSAPRVGWRGSSPGSAAEFPALRSACRHADAISSELFDRNSTSSVHLIRLSRSCIEHSSPNSELHAKRTGFTTATGT